MQRFKEFDSSQFDADWDAHFNQRKARDDERAKNRAIVAGLSILAFATLSGVVAYEHTKPEPTPEVAYTDLTSDPTWQPMPRTKLKYEIREEQRVAKSREETQAAEVERKLVEFASLRKEFEAEPEPAPEPEPEPQVTAQQIVAQWEMEYAKLRWEDAVKLCGQKMRQCGVAAAGYASEAHLAKQAAELHLSVFLKYGVEANYLPLWHQVSAIEKILWHEYYEGVRSGS